MFATHLSFKSEIYGEAYATPTAQEKEDPSALFFTASHFNHECVPNARYLTFADVIAVRSRVPIKSGAEIFISYIDIRDGDAAALSSLLVHFRNGCECKPCKLDKIDGPLRLERRNAIKQKLDSEVDELLFLIASRPSGARVKLEGYLASLRSTSSSRASDQLLPEMGLVYGLLSRTLGTSNLSQSLEYELKEIQSSNGVVECIYPGKKAKGSVGRRIPSKILVQSGVSGSTTIGTMALIKNASDCRKAGQPGEMRLWLDAAVEMENIASGGGEPLFKERYLAQLSNYGLSDLFV